MSSRSNSSTSQRINAQGKNPMEIRPKPKDIKDKYDAFFPIFSDDEGKRFSSLIKRNLCMPKYFDDELLKEIGMHDFVNVLCRRLGWQKLKFVKYDVFHELTLEFYTTLKIKDEEQRIFSCRFFGREYKFDYDTLTEIFDFHEGGICNPPKDFDMIGFWAEITQGDKISHGDTMVSGLISSHSFLLMHKFMVHNIFGRNDSTRVTPDELFVIWCMATNRRVNSAYLVFRSMWRVVQGRRALISMGHIVTGLATRFVPLGLTRLAPLDREIFNEDFLIKAEIISEFQRRLEDVEYRRCYQLRKIALKDGDVPLPKFIENFDDVSEEEEEDVKPNVTHENAKKSKKDGKTKPKKKNEPIKRKRFEESIEKIEQKIENVANRTDARLGNMMMDVMTKFEVYETLRDAMMGNLMAEVKELKQLITQSIGTKASTEPSVEIIPETSSSNASY